MSDGAAVTLDAFGRCKDCVLWAAYETPCRRGHCLAPEAKEPVVRLEVQVDGKGSDGKTYRLKGVGRAVMETLEDFGCASFQARLPEEP